jgi:predicted NBD/HSP70 family sugar kinase
MIQPAGAHTVREHNRALVLDAIAAAPGQSRARLAAATHLARATVSAQVDELIASGLVVETPPPRPTRGRPASPLLLNPAGPAGLGIEINAGYLSACVVDLTGAVRSRRRTTVDNRAAAPSATIEAAAAAATEALAASGLRAAGVALGIPALVGLGGVAGRAPNLPGWRGFPAATALAEALGLPVVTVDNEANLAALAEHRYGDGADSFVHVSGEIGVGGGLVLGGELFRGMRGFAGELGHISIDPTGPVCGCGGRGCVEQFAGQVALLRSGGVSSTEELIEAAESGGRAARAAIARAGTALGVALAGVINVVDVPVAILGGMYARLGPWLVPPLAAELDTRVVSGLPVEVRTGALGSDAAMLGAAGAVLDSVMAGDLPAAPPTAV